MEEVVVTRDVTLSVSLRVCVSMNAQGAEMKGEFSLKSAGEIKAVNIKKKFPHCLEVQTPNRHYRMSADNEESVRLLLQPLLFSSYDATCYASRKASHCSTVSFIRWRSGWLH
jgi:hypothetical protein